jgi:hypothetical protein
MKKVFALAVAACLAVAHVGSADVIDEFEDDCSVSVLIKYPYSESIQFDQNDIVLGRGWQGNACTFIDPNGPLQITGICQNVQNQGTGWTQWYRYSTLDDVNGRFRWICGLTKERSRCAAGTKWARFRFLPNSNEFRTQCDDGN